MACFFFFNDTATTEIYTLSLHDALPIYVYGGDDSGARHCVVIDPGGAVLMVDRELRHHAEREPVNVSGLEEVIALGQRWCRRDPTLGSARDRAQIFHIGRHEQAAIVNPEGVRRVGKETELQPRTHLVLVSRERRVMVVEPYPGPELPLVRGRDGRLRVHSDVAAAK